MHCCTWPRRSGYENIDEMIRAKMGDYAAQSLSYEQAAEELVSDAWGGIFDSEESVRRWAQFQREQADQERRPCRKHPQGDAAGEDHAGKHHLQSQGSAAH